MIRAGKIEDLEQIQKLNQLLFIKEQKEYDSLYNIDWSLSKEGEEYFHKRLTEDGRKVFVAEINNKIIGYLAASSRIDNAYRNNLKIAEIGDVMVLEEYRSQGIGAKLSAAFEEWAKSIGVKRLLVLASSPNERGIDFYKKQGFKIYEVGLKKDL